MARQHARIVTAIWSDPDFLALSSGAQRMFMALLTQPKITMVGGLDYMPKRWAAQAVDLDETDIEHAVAELERTRFVFVDRDVDEIVIRTFVKGDQSAKSGTQRAAMWSAWSALASPRLRRVVLDELPEYAWEPDDKGNGGPPADAVTLRDTPTDTPSDTPTDGVSDTPTDTHRYPYPYPEPDTRTLPPHENGCETQEGAGDLIQQAIDLARHRALEAKQAETTIHSPDKWLTWHEREFEADWRERAEGFLAAYDLSVTQLADCIRGQTNILRSLRRREAS